MGNACTVTRVNSVFRLPVKATKHPAQQTEIARSAVRPETRGGGIVAGYLAPHPPHLVYADNPPQNEPRSQGGWESLRWAYDDIRKKLKKELKPDVIVVHAPHWITMIGHHVNCVPNPKGYTVEPIFPHLLRYHYDFTTDVELANAIAEEAEREGLVTRRMTNPGVRVDYATISALHMLNPDWDIPVVGLSANNNPYFYSRVGLEEVERFGVATRRAIERLGRRAVLAASNSLSHLHYDVEPDLPEDMHAERVFNNFQYSWDMRMLELLRRGRTREFRALVPQFIDETAAEIKGGSLSWMMAALDWPEIPARVLAYGTVIGTGNAVAEWDLEPTYSRNGS
jgi:2-aminophenol/2-amino-5-chlorophenol 1,6-dioxygenase subunit beta